MVLKGMAIKIQKMIFYRSVNAFTFIHKNKRRATDALGWIGQK